MSDIHIPKHIAARIERRWAEKIEQERLRQRSIRSHDPTNDRKNRTIKDIRR